MKFSVVINTPDTRREIILVENGKFTQAAFEESKDLTPFIQFCRNGCNGPCPCYTIRRNRLTEDELVKAMYIPFCPGCRGLNRRLFWEDEESQPTDSEYIGKETHKHRQDRLMEIEVSEFYGSYNPDHMGIDNWTFSIRVFKGQLVIMGEQGVIPEEEFKDDDFHHFIEFYKRGCVGQCPCHVRRSRDPNNQHPRPTRRDQFSSSMIIVDCKHCKGNARLLWRDESLIVIPGILNIDSSTKERCK
jgi:hypothetical protein